MYKKFIAILFSLLVCLTSTSAAQQSDLNQIGTSMSNFLKIGVGARATAMGNSFVALSDDVSSTYWNPGGLAFTTKDQVMMQVTNWLADTKHYFFALSYSVGSLGKIGLSVNSFNSGDIEETTLNQPDGTGRTFDAGNIAAALSFSRSFTDRFSAGVTLKYISEELDRTSASTFAVDIGSIFITSFLNNMRIGISLSNLGGRMSLDGSDLSVQYLPSGGTKYVTSQLRTEPWDLPLLFRFGVATTAIETGNYKLTVSSEVVDSRDFDYRASLGGEFSFQNIFYLRGGYKFNHDESDLSFGAGVGFPEFSGFEITADYSYNDYGVLNTVHSISLIISY